MRQSNAFGAKKSAIGARLVEFFFAVFLLHVLQAGCSRGLPLNHHVLLWMVWRLAPSQGAWKMKKHTYGWWQYCAASVQFNFNFYICIYTTHIYEQKYVYNLNLR